MQWVPLQGYLLPCVCTFFFLSFFLKSPPLKFPLFVKHDLIFFFIFILLLSLNPIFIIIVMFPPLWKYKRWQQKYNLSFLCLSTALCFSVTLCVYFFSVSLTFRTKSLLCDFFYFLCICKFSCCMPIPPLLLIHNDIITSRLCVLLLHGA